MSFTNQPPFPTHRQFARAEKYGPDLGFRKGTPITHTPVDFFLNGGGVGDYINYSAALLWIAENCPWVHGTVYANSYFLPFLNLIFRKYPNMRPAGGEKVTLDGGTCMVGPEIVIEGRNVNPQLINATGAHLMDLGFMYYANKSKAPDSWTLPHLTFPKEKIPRELRGKRYVVVTTGAIVPSRELTGKHINPLVSHIISKGLTPVFLRRSKITPGHGTHFASDIDYSKGIDLLDKTTLLEAAAICEHAVCVLGLDNGLLHLASCTNANVIFGYNITSIEHRIPRRATQSGVTFNLTVPKEELSCIGCQSNVRLLINHSYHQCLYGDNRCIDILFSSGEFESAIDLCAKGDERALSG